MTGELNVLKEKRAKFAHELAYLHESVSEDAIDDRMEKVENQYVHTSVAEFKEAVDMVNEMPDSFEEDEQAELRRIMEATEDLSFDQMVGIEE